MGTTRNKILKPFHPSASRWTFPSFRVSTRWADRPKAETLRTVSPKGFPARRPLGLQTSRSNGRGPEGLRPAESFLPKACWPTGSIHPRAFGSRGWAIGRPNSTMMRLNKIRRSAKKNSVWRYFLVGNFPIFQKLSTIHSKTEISCLNSFVALGLIRKRASAGSAAKPRRDQLVGGDPGTDDP